LIAQFITRRLATNSRSRIRSFAKPVHHSKAHKEIVKDVVGDRIFRQSPNRG
jgi:hypothetical protein